MDAAVAALLGAGIGAAGTAIVAWLQTRSQARRELVRAAVDVSLAEYSAKLALVKERGGTVHGISVFIAYHAAVLRAISDDAYTPEKAKELDDHLTAHLQAREERAQSRTERY